MSTRIQVTHTQYRNANKLDYCEVNKGNSPVSCNILLRYLKFNKI